MLVLSRKVREGIVINDVISVIVVEIRANKVRLGIEAPKDVSVHREEVQRALEQSRTGTSTMSENRPISRQSSKTTGTRKQRGRGRER